MDTRERYDRRQSESDPTPELIALYASAIRMSWSPDEEWRRRVQKCGYQPPDAHPVIVQTLSPGSQYVDL